MGTSVATYHYMKKGFMKWKICIPAIFGAIAGSWMGSHLALLISDRVLKIAMVIVLPVILFYVLRSKALQGNDENTTDAVNGMLIFKCILIAVVIGIYDGIYGPGTGTFLMLLFTGFCHMTLNDAAGTTKAINLTTNITALVVFLINGKVLLPLGIAAGCCNMAGNYLGSHSFTSNGHKIVIYGRTSGTGSSHCSGQKGRLDTGRRADVLLRSDYFAECTRQMAADRRKILLLR